MKGRENGENYEFLNDRGDCKITPTVNDTHMIFETSISGTSGTEGAMISRMHKFVSYLLLYFSDLFIF